MWAIGLVAMVVTGCNGGGHALNDDASVSTDAQSNSDVPSLDHAGGDGGADAIDLLCVVPADCPPFLTCWVTFENGSDCPAGIACCATAAADGTGTVSCRPQSLCAPGGSTYIACASDGDCPPVRPTCAPLASTAQGDFKVCA
jgi:hypothetical protein